MIGIKATLKGVPFWIRINGKEVKHKDIYGKVTQWFPPQEVRVMSMINKEDYLQWIKARNEEEVYNIIKVDLMKDGCVIVEEER